MENQMTSLKCRKCGQIVSADQKKCPKCGAPILLKVMQEEEKRHLPAKEIREKDKRMRKEYAKLNKEKELERQKAEKKKQQLEEKEEKKRQKAKQELETIRLKEEQKENAAKERAQKQEAKAEALEAKKAEKSAKKAEKSAKKEATNAEQKGRKTLILWLVLAALLLAAGVAASIFIFTNREAAEPVIPEQTELVEETVEEQTEEVAEEPSVETAEEAAEPQSEQTAPEAVQEPVSQPAEEPAPPSNTRNITRNNYLFPSDTQYLTDADLNGLSQFDTGLIRNEIYARKGYVFKDEPYKSYFNSQAWYNPNPAAKMRLNETEKYNVNFLLEYERSQGWR